MSFPRRTRPNRNLDREPPLSLEEFGHLVSTAFERHHFPTPLLLNNPSDNIPSPIDASGHVSNPTTRARSSTEPSPISNPPTSRVTRTTAFKWFNTPGQNSDSPPSLSAIPSSSSFPTPHTPSETHTPLTSQSRKPRPRTRLSTKRSAMSMFGNLKSKMSLERLPTRRATSASRTSTSHLSPHDKDDDIPHLPIQLPPRPAPFFYAQSRPVSELSQGLSGESGSVNSLEIMSWKQKAKAKKKQSTRSLRELFKLNTKIHIPIPPVPPIDPELQSQFLEHDSDPFAASPGGLERLTPLDSPGGLDTFSHFNSSPLETDRPRSPVSVYSSTEQEGGETDMTMTTTFESSFDQSMSVATPDQSFSPPRVHVRRPGAETEQQSPHHLSFTDREQPSPNHFSVIPLHLSPIQMPNAWLLESELAALQSGIRGATSPVREKAADAVVMPATAPLNIVHKNSLKEQTRSIKKARSFSNSSQSNSASSHTNSNSNHSYHTAVSRAISPAHSQRSGSPPTKHPFHAPPSAFRLSSPPRRRTPCKKDASKSIASMTIPGIWTSSSISHGVDLELSSSGSQSPSPPGMAAMEQVLDGDRSRSSLEDKSSNASDGSWETAYTRPKRQHNHRRSRSFDALVLSSKGLQHPLEHSLEQGRGMVALDSFVAASTPLAWPLPPRLRVVVDKVTGVSWRDVSPIKEFVQSGSPLVDPSSRHSIFYKKGQSTVSLPNPVRERYKLAYPAPKTAPVISQKTSMCRLAQESKYYANKPLPARPGSSQDENPLYLLHSSDSSGTSSSDSHYSLAGQKTITSSLSLRIFLGGEELALNPHDRTEMPTIFILCEKEEEEIRFETKHWSQLIAFCEAFEHIALRTESDGARMLHISVVEVRSKLSLCLSLKDTVVITRSVKPIMKSKLAMPTTLGQVSLEIKKVPLGQGFYV